MILHYYININIIVPKSFLNCKISLSYYLNLPVKALERGDREIIPVTRNHGDKQIDFLI